jgi:predicted PurR-regulated permease PerM
MDTENKTINININTLTIVKLLLILVIIFFLFLIKDILAIFFAALVLASALDPWVDVMQKKKIPRSVGILLLYLVLFLLIGTVIYLIVPPITQEIGDLSNNFPYYYNKLVSKFSTVQDYSSQYGLENNIKNVLLNLGANLQNTAGSIFSTVSGIFGGIFSFFLILVLTFYMTVEESAIKKLVWSIVPLNHQSYAMQLINRMQIKIGLWLRGQLILCLSIFVLSYIGLLIFGVKYALVLALIAGMTEFVPYLGPTLGAVPAVFLAFAQSPMLAVFIAGLYYVIQLVENNILVPKVMQKAVGLNPIISIAVLMIGFKLAGVLGAILSIPVATATNVFIVDLFDNRSPEDEVEGET